MYMYSHILLLIGHGNDKARQFGGHVGLHTGVDHFQDVDRSTVGKVLYGEENKIKILIGARDSLIQLKLLYQSPL